MLAGAKVIRLAEPRTVRLVTTARLRPPVLEALVPAEMLESLYAIEGATSGRLMGQSRGSGGVEPHEYVYDVPHAAFINASFAYARPRALNRFSGSSRGAWYAAKQVETSLREVIFHLTRELANVGKYDAVVQYAEMHASLAGEYLTLEDVPSDAQCLHTDPLIAYPAGNALTDHVRSQGLNGIVYPSVRHKGGTCYAVLRPAAVQSVAQGSVYEIRWEGHPEPSVIELDDKAAEQAA